MVESPLKRTQEQTGIDFQSVETNFPLISPNFSSGRLNAVAEGV